MVIVPLSTEEVLPPMPALALLLLSVVPVAFSVPVPPDWA
jgi:hypothetical protein